MAMTKEEIDERQKFSSGGRTYWLILRGRVGPEDRPAYRALDRFLADDLAICQGARHALQPGGDADDQGPQVRGKQRTQVLPYTEWEGSYIVVGSNGGGPNDPGWVHNVRADGNGVGAGKRPPRADARRASRRAMSAGAVIDHVSIRSSPSSATTTPKPRSNGRQLPLVILTPR